MQTLNVCLWAGPGVGKSVTAALLFAALKLERVQCELVTEFAKDLSYEGVLRDTPQEVILREQMRRLHRVQGKVEVVVTDAPPHVSQLYAQPDERDFVDQHLAEHAAGMDFWHVLLERDLASHYEQNGRWQTPSQAQSFHRNVVEPFVKSVPGQRYFELHVDEAVRVLVPAVLSRLLRPEAPLRKAA